MKNELEHQLDLLKIYKETSDALSKSIAIMAQFTPPYMTYDFNEKMKKARETILYCVELIRGNNVSVSPASMEILKTIVSDSMNQKKLRLGIILLEEILEKSVKEEDAHFFEKTTGMNIHLVNCKNVIIGSDLNTDSFRMGDETM